jgi:alginate O-acetyltransferase complex protein AlgI
MNETFVRLLLMSAAALPVYYVLPRRFQNMWLLAASVIFYALWSVPHVVVLIAITLFNYAAALLITRLTGPARLWGTISGIALNVLVLITLKYAVIDALIRGTFGDALTILLPLGLSFTTLQAIAYLVEVKKGRFPAEQNLIDFALYLVYFPKMAAGPIERPRTFLAQIKAPRVVINDTLRRALTLIVLGMVRKVLFADTLSRMLNPRVFDDPLSYNGPTLAISLITYSFVIYNDFAGYSSLARGISELFGIHLYPSITKLPAAVPCAQRIGILDTMAYHAVGLAARLCLLSRQQIANPHSEEPRSHHSHCDPPIGGDAGQRVMA